MGKQKIEVCAAVIRREDEILICGRRKGTSLEGYFEFPGGKFEPGETLAQATKRELWEELNAEVIPMDEIGYAEAETEEKIYCLHFIRTMLFPADQEIRGAEGQEVKWIRTKNLLQAGLLPSDLTFAKFLIMTVPANRQKS